MVREHSLKRWILNHFGSCRRVDVSVEFSSSKRSVTAMIAAWLSVGQNNGACQFQQVV